MNLTDILYSLGWHTIRPVLAVAGMFSPKLRHAVAGRRHAARRMAAWAAGQPDGEAGKAGEARGPLLWLHGASAGELEGAAPVIRVLRGRIPDLRLVVTYSSPSGEGAAISLAPDFHGFVPLDLDLHTDAAMRALHPDALVYAKLDVWPSLTGAARRAGVPVGMINATVRPGSARLRRPGRAMMKTAYGTVRAVGAVSEDERSRLEALGVRPAAIRVTGDAAFDQAFQRLDAARGGASGPAGPSGPRLPPRIPGTVRLIAGSTWAEDEAFLVEAIAQVDGIELVLVPHEPTPEAVERIRERAMRSLGRAPRVLSELAESRDAAGEHGEKGALGPAASPPPIIVDAVGFLAELYLEGDIAYIGGALAGTGLHSVVEPAAAGLPILFGSRHDRWEAKELVTAGAAREAEPGEIAEMLTEILDAALRRRMGVAALAYARSRAGADEAGADLVESLLRPWPRFSPNPGRR